MDRLVELGQLLDDGQVSSPDMASFRKACEQAWSDLVAMDLSESLDLSDLSLVVSQGRDLLTLRQIPPAIGHGVSIFVADRAAGLADHVLEAAGAPILVADHRNGTQAVEILRRNQD
ncbi:MAG: hypothetical protein WD313_01090, partial [Acidimicrobiia bacterium]